LIYTFERHDMEKSDWKYQEQIKNIANCPPSDYKLIDMVGFRWVFEDKKHLNNFLPPLAIVPSRKFKTDEERCSGYALSFFDSSEKAITLYLNISKKRKNFGTIVGDHVARV